MPIHYFWGDDDFALMKEVSDIKNQYLDHNWIPFNFNKFTSHKEDVIREAFLQAMTPPFGMGDRIVWLEDTNICQACSEELLAEIKRTIQQIPDTTHLIFTSSKKPDGRIKSTKLISQYTKVKEFSLIPPWQTDVVIKKVEEMAGKTGVKFTPNALKLLANSVGNNSRLLWQELEKLALYQGENKNPIEENTVKSLVNVSSQNSLQLAGAILKNDLSSALSLVQDLITINEAPLRIVATLVGQFRTWAVVKTLIEEGEKDEKKIAECAEIMNPKRIYFIRQEIKESSSKKLLSSLPILLELESSLKLGADPLNCLQTKIVELCNIRD